MSKKLLYILLLISLAFNISFLSMFAYHRIVMRKIHRMNQPGIPPDHEFQPNFRKIMEDLKPIQDEFHKIRHDFIIDLSRKEFNEENAKKLLDEAIQKQLEMEREIGIRFINIRKNMSDEKAKRFFRNLASHENRKFQERKRRKDIPKRRKK